VTTQHASIDKMKNAYCGTSIPSMPSRNTQAQLYLLHMNVSLASSTCKFRLKFVEYVTPNLNFVFLYLKYISKIYTHLAQTSKGASRRCYLRMSLDGATSFIILWSKDSDTWDVRLSDTWLVQREFNSCCQMVARNGTQLRILGNCILTLIGHRACRPCTHACIN